MPVIIGGTDPCTHREALREPGMIITQGVSSLEEIQIKYLDSIQKAMNGFC